MGRFMWEWIGVALCLVGCGTASEPITKIGSGETRVHRAALAMHFDESVPERDRQPLFEKVNIALTGVPLDIQEIFTQLDGQLLVTPDATTQCQGHGAQVANVGGCFRAQSDGLGKQMTLTIMIQAEQARMSERVIRIFGYFFAQYLTRLYPVDGGFALSATENDSFRKFLEDLAKSYPENQVERRGHGFQDWVFAEAFYYYFSQNEGFPREVMQKFHEFWTKIVYLNGAKKAGLFLQSGQTSSDVIYTQGPPLEGAVDIFTTIPATDVQTLDAFSHQISGVTVNNQTMPVNVHGLQAVNDPGQFQSVLGGTVAPTTFPTANSASDPFSTVQQPVTIGNDPAQSSPLSSPVTQFLEPTTYGSTGQSPVHNQGAMTWQNDQNYQTPNGQQPVYVFQNNYHFNSQNSSTLLNHSWLEQPNAPGSSDGFGNFNWFSNFGPMQWGMGWNSQAGGGMGWNSQAGGGGGW